MNFDVVIVGAGLVGASLARALSSATLSVALVDPFAAAEISDEWDARIYAVSPTSMAFLQSLAAWQRLDRTRVQAVTQMRVWGDQKGALLEFGAYDAGVGALAYIAESGRLAHALAQSLEGGVQLYAPARCSALEIGAAGAVLTLASGETLNAKLVVGADGASSWVRRMAGLSAVQHDYHQLGVVANFSCSEAHHGTALQWFRADGVLAFLPLPGQRMSMVWSTPEAHAQELLALDASTLAARVAAAGEHALGTLEALTPARAFALHRLRAEALVAPRVALVGDAAHVVHPLAGQGVNLGFGDASALAATLAAREAFRDCGDLVLLRRYARRRAEAILAMRTVTDGLVHLFAAPGRVSAGVRNAGLNLTNHLPVVKNLLVRHALG
jgi:2-octaprenylphenol hydroxylase